MNKGLLIGGIASLVLAVLMGVLYLTLPADKIMYMVGDQNVPWVPAVVFGIVGVVLLVFAMEGAFLLIILGAFLLVKPWFDKRRLFGKAEEA